MSVVELTGVSKAYGEILALQDVSLRLDRGEIVVLVGPNGAGKTTLTQIVAGLVEADAGRVEVCGFAADSDRTAVREKIGLLPQGSLPDPQASAWEHVYYYLWARIRRRREAAYAAETALRAVDLWERRHERAARLSGGMQRRILLAMTLGAEPPVLLLDEPAAALDPDARHELWNRLADARRGGAILLTTHDMAEAEALADRVALIASGRIVACDAPARLLGSLPAREKVVLEVDAAESVAVDLPAYGVVREIAGRPVLYPVDDAATRAAGAALLAARLPFSVRAVSLEDAYLHLLHGSGDRIDGRVTGPIGI